MGRHSYGCSDRNAMKFSLGVMDMSAVIIPKTVQKDRGVLSLGVYYRAKAVKMDVAAGPGAAPER